MRNESGKLCSTRFELGRVDLTMSEPHPEGVDRSVRWDAAWGGALTPPLSTHHHPEPETDRDTNDHEKEQREQRMTDSMYPSERFRASRQEHHQTDSPPKT
jgi:hypothetical protein